MSETAWEKGKLTAVYHPVGKRTNGEDRYKRANFDLLRWKAPGASREETYVITPISSVEQTSDDIGALVTDDHARGREFGFYELGIEVVEVHEGNGSDSWKGLQTFGYV